LSGINISAVSLKTYTIIGGVATEQGEVTEVRPAYLALFSKPYEYLYANSILLKLMP